MTTTTCEHPPGAQYQDADEIRCRVCARSLTFAPRPPTKEEKSKGAFRNKDGIALRRDPERLAGSRGRGKRYAKKNLVN